MPDGADRRIGQRGHLLEARERRVDAAARGGRVCEAETQVHGYSPFICLLEHGSIEKSRRVENVLRAAPHGMYTGIPQFNSVPERRNAMTAPFDGRAIRVGVVTDMTGPLSFLGFANASVARMVIDDINANGGLLGRQLALCLEDSATIDSLAEAKARKLVQEDRVDVILGGIYSSTRQAIKSAAVTDGKKLYIYPEQYEGQECHPLIFCTGPVPAQQLASLIPWLMQKTGARKFYCPSADY